MARVLSLSMREELLKLGSGVPILMFIKFSFPGDVVAYRFVSDKVDYVWGGETWKGIPFDFQLLSDDENPPTATVSIPNVDRRIGQTVSAVDEPLEVELTVILGSQFDQTVIPRTEIGTAIKEMQATELTLTGVSINALEITGTLRSWEFRQEVIFGMRATKNRFPGLFR
jgi:hypothetical protein